MAYFVRVKPEAHRRPKWAKLGRLLNTDRHGAFGLAVALWSLCWENEWLDGKIPPDEAEDLAASLLWKGESDKLIEAFLECGVIEKDSHGILTAHDFEKEQRAGIAICKRSRARSAQRIAEVESEVKPEFGPKEEAVRQIVQAMRQSKITGSANQKREQCEAWMARGIKGADILELISKNPGKDIFDLKKLLANGTPKTAEESAREAGARIEAAAKDMFK